MEGVCGLLSVSLYCQSVLLGHWVTVYTCLSVSLGSGSRGPGQVTLEGGQERVGLWGDWPRGLLWEVSCIPGESGKPGCPEGCLRPAFLLFCPVGGPGQETVGSSLWDGRTDGSRAPVGSCSLAPLGRLPARLRPGADYPPSPRDCGFLPSQETLWGH